MTYLVIASLAVVGYVLWSSGVHERREARAPAVPSAAGSRPVVPAEDGAVVPVGSDVVTPSGLRYWSPTAAISVSDVLVVGLTVTAPQTAGAVAVPAPSVVLVDPGPERDPWRTQGGPERRTSRGGTVGFSASFDDVAVEVGDLVTLRLELDDGTHVQYEDVEVRYHRPPSG